MNFTNVRCSVLVALALIQISCAPQSQNVAIDAYLQQPENLARLSNALDSYRNAQRQKAAQEQEAKEEALVQEQLKNPLAVEIGKSPVLGNKDSPVKIILFGDYECPFTAAAFSDLYKLQSRSKDIALIFKHVPLPSHRQARAAAFAAMAAEEQGKFWEYSRRMLKDQDLLGLPAFVDYAKRENLDVSRFESAFIKHREAYEARIKKDFDTAKLIGVDSIPVTVVNGVRYDGERGYEGFSNIIDVARKIQQR